MFKSIAEAEQITGSLSKPSKMPGYAYGLPASRCKVGSALNKVPGSVCSKCYALKGRYVFPNVQQAQFKRLFSITNPAWVDAMAYQIQKRGCKHFRWHDSGDIQSMEHLQKIVEVVRRCPETSFWIPTRETQVIRQYLGAFKAFPTNLCVRVSATMIDGPTPLAFPNTSQVSSDRSKVTCHASLTGSSCQDCRACWDSTVANVTYKKH